MVGNQSKKAVQCVFRCHGDLSTHDEFTITTDIKEYRRPLGLVGEMDLSREPNDCFCIAKDVAIVCIMSESSNDGEKQNI